MAKKINIEGVVFGRLTAIKPDGKNNSNKIMWLCSCSCGKETRATVDSLKRRNTSSCGCFGKEQKLKGSTKHGMKHSSEYSIWMELKGRCRKESNRQYENYGGRGIKVCQRWVDDFKNFFEDMGARPSINHSLDRENNDGDYEKSNCRWVTIDVQCRNKRNNRWFEYNDKRMVLSDWANEIGVSGTTIKYHLKTKSFGETVEILREKKSNGCRSIKTRMFEYNGVRLSLNDWCVKMGITESSLRKRLAKGQQFSDIICFYKKKRKLCC